MHIVQDASHIVHPRSDAGDPIRGTGDEDHSLNCIHAHAHAHVMLILEKNKSPSHGHIPRPRAAVKRAVSSSWFLRGCFSEDVSPRMFLRGLPQSSRFYISRCIYIARAASGVLTQALRRPVTLSWSLEPPKARAGSTRTF